MPKRKANNQAIATGLAYKEKKLGKIKGLNKDAKFSTTLKSNAFKNRVKAIKAGLDAKKK